MNISHWEQYLTPLGTTKLNIKPDSFQNLLTWNSIVLPIFQRKYCWREKQLQRYWYDLLHIALSIGNLGHRTHRRRHDNAHTLGKIITFEEINRITVIDGQQRLTTTLIILIAIRQHLSKSIHANHDKYKQLRKNIDKILFSHKVPKHITYEEGDSLPFVRFIPTYFDRSYFYDVLLDKVPNKKLNNKDINIYFAKTYFEKELQKYSDYTKIKLLYSHLLTQFKFVYVGIPKIDKNNVCHSIYQWFFERELYIEQGGGDRPGYTQTVCDLFRNYLLSFFITETLVKQKQIYQLWIEVERTYENMIEFNQRLIDLIEVKSTTVYKPYTLYRDLVAFIESKLKKYEESEYKIFMQELLINLKCRKGGYAKKELVLIYGFLRGIESVFDTLATCTEITQLISIYLSQDTNNTINTNASTLIGCIDEELSNKLRVISD